jgi:hypothetical protein
MKKNREEPIKVLIHTYMEMSQGNSLCSHLIQAKMSLFFFFLFFLLQNWRTGRWNRSARGGIGTSEGGEVVGKGCRSMNMVQYCVDMHVNVKMRPVGTIPGKRESGGVKENNGGNKFKHYIFNTL